MQLLRIEYLIFSNKQSIDEITYKTNYDKKKG